LYHNRKEEANMSVVSTPVSGRLRVTYLNNLPSFQLSGISPGATPIQARSFVQAVSDIQSGTMDNAMVIVESDLTED